MGRYINQLTALTSLAAGDNVAIGSSSNGDDRRASLTALTTYLQSALTIVDALAMAEYLTQYAAPAATGQNIQITDADDNIHLIITPVAGYAAMTITLPTSTNLIDKQDILVNCTQAVTTLTIAGNGATVVGAPTTLAANDYFRLKYDLAGNTWYCVNSGDATSITGYLLATTSTANTIALRDASANLTANVLVSDVAIGTAPLTVTSTTAVSNLNADQTDGYDADETDTGSTLAARDATGDIQANAFESTVATGTAPLTVASTTAVSNLNSDQTDGYDAQIASGASTIVVQDTDAFAQVNDIVIEQGAPAAKTVSATLTAAEIATKLITVNEGTTNPSALQLPLATAMDIEFDTLGADQAIDFSLINISAVAAETASITTNTGWTLVGNMLVAANTAITDISQGRFRARRTGAGAWTLYRIA